MQIEFVGLPGSGKTTVAFAIEGQLKSERYQIDGLRNAARRAMKTAQADISFLQRRGERVSLYGCMVWAHKYPDLYEWMFRLSHSDFVALVWGMEMLSQQGILLAHGDKDLIVLTDEGYLQRLAWNFIEREDEAKIDKISALLPPDFVTIYLTIDPKLSFERTKSRRKGVPIGLKCSDEAATLAKFTRYGVMLDRLVEARQALGHSVMRVDAMQDVEKVAKDVVQHLTPLLSPPLPARKKRGAPS